METSKYIVTSGKNFRLSNYKTDDCGKFKSKEDAVKLMHKNITTMIELQDKLSADNRYALLLVFQGMDAAGKDGMIKHVTSGLNPQGTSVVSFKQPSAVDLDHDYLWRIAREVPERGRIGIFNRSHYEEVLVVRVHDLLNNSEHFPKALVTKDIWKKRFEQISNFEKYLFENGIITLKFFLNISKDEQKKRFIRRLEDPSRNWKFAEGDLKERKSWDQYQNAFEDAIKHTSHKYAPWYIIPADKKWYARLVVSQIIVDKLKSMKLKYPEMSDESKAHIEEWKKQLMEEV